jgi:hypothetical protein
MSVVWETIRRPLWGRRNHLSNGYLLEDLRNGKTAALFRSTLDNEAGGSFSQTYSTLFISRLVLLD